VLGQQTIN